MTLHVSYQPQSPTKYQVVIPSELQSEREKELTVLPTDRDWEARRDEIIYFYRDREYTLNDVIKVIQDKYLWKVTPRMFKTRFDKWGIRKYQRHVPRRERSSRSRRRSAAMSVTLDVHTPSTSPDGRQHSTMAGLASMISGACSITGESPYSTATSTAASATAAAAAGGTYSYSYASYNSPPTPLLQSSPRISYSYLGQGPLAYNETTLSSQAGTIPRSSVTPSSVYAPPHPYATVLPPPLPMTFMPNPGITQHLASSSHIYLPRSSSLGSTQYTIDYADSLTATSPLVPLSEIDASIAPSSVNRDSVTNADVSTLPLRHGSSKCPGHGACPESAVKLNAELLRSISPAIAANGTRGQMEMYQALNHTVSYMAHLRCHVRMCCQNERLLTDSPTDMRSHVRSLMNNVYPTLCSGIVGLVKATSSRAVLNSLLSALETESIAIQGPEHALSSLAMCLRYLFTMYPQDAFRCLIEDISQRMCQKIFELFGRGSPVGLYYLLESQCSYIIDEGIMVNLDNLLKSTHTTLRSHPQSTNIEMARSMAHRDHDASAPTAITSNSAGNSSVQWVEARAIIELTYKVARTKLDIRETDPTISTLMEDVLHRCTELRKAAMGHPHSKQVQTELSIVEALVPRISLIMAQNLYYRGVESADNMKQSQAIQWLENSLEHSSRCHSTSRLFHLSIGIARRMFEACNDAQALLRLQELEYRFKGPAARANPW
ncbi:uncharacterized protein BROUX77_000121 [Berkeleyomyces rouxiae]|uniref:uncharacterized protein n=1 Tax=Berkeleyomyces rouxiae TaxID=2035830 RepID=UPI003B81844C